MSDIDLIEQRLALRGHRLTGSRRRVLEAIAGQPAHFTVDEVVHSSAGVGRATVFRTIRLLLDLNVVCRVLLDDGTLHYRVSVHGHHHHLVCRGCGRVEDFTTCDVKQLIGQLSSATDYQIEGHWLELYGRCSECASGAPLVPSDG
ncbi:MAG TPA: Fur family transcriptional regulator [Dehalococcoidia bacterium]|nr:Fur family transcriptional regulator [Dehalococcoidia bacterium]